MTVTRDSGYFMGTLYETIQSDRLKMIMGWMIMVFANLVDV
jgi:hypothetical protein